MHYFLKQLIRSSTFRDIILIAAARSRPAVLIRHIEILYFQSSSASAYFYVLVSFSHVPDPQNNTNMGGELGQLKSDIRGVITTKLSPFEQKAFKGLFSHGVPNAIKRTASNLPYIVPPMIVGYIVYDWAVHAHHESLRKNPADFANDQ